MKFMLKAPGTKRLKLKCDTLLSSFALKFNLRRYMSADYETVDTLDEVHNHNLRNVLKVGWCRLLLSKTVLRAHMVSALETII